MLRRITSDPAMYAFMLSLSTTSPASQNLCDFTHIHIWSSTIIMYLEPRFHCVHGKFHVVLRVLWLPAPRVLRVTTEHFSNHTAIHQTTNVCIRSCLSTNQYITTLPSNCAMLIPYCPRDSSAFAHITAPGSLLYSFPAPETPSCILKFLIALLNS